MTETSTGSGATAAVGTDPIVPSAATFSAGLSSNYTITYTNGTLTVNPAALTITANNATKTYGQTATFAATAFTTSGLVNGDTVTSVTETSTGAAATAPVSGSPYSIVPSAATLARAWSNYTISYVNGTLTVNPAALDDHGQQREQDLRPDGDLRRHRVHDQRPGQRRHGQQRDRDQHRRGGDGGASGPTPSCPAPRRSRRA